MTQTEIQILKLKKRISEPGLSPANKVVLQKLLDRLETKSKEKAMGLAPERPIEKSSSTAATSAVIKSLVSSVDTQIESKPSKAISYNAQQRQAIQYALEGKSFVLTGPAGSGKTTTYRGIVDALIESGRAGILSGQGHKYLMDETPGMVLISFTNKAVENVKKRLPHELHRNCMTSHKLLEYEPVFEERTNDNGERVTSRTFEPQRNANRPLPSSLRILSIDEATMTDVPLWNRIIEALPQRTDPDVQLILIGDINQLPPVFGKSIFIHALQQKMLRVVLTEIYRQALENPILALAHRILSGKIIPPPELKEWNIDKLAEGNGKLTIMPWKKKLSDTAANVFMRNKLPQFIDHGLFDPEEDVIITPFNVGFGTELLNNIVASHHAKRLGAEVYEIYTGIKKVYLRVGERVLHNKSEHRVVAIKPNFQYFGRTPRPASDTMNYEGIESDKEKMLAATSNGPATDEDINDYVDRMLEHLGSPVDDDSPTRRAASHVVVVRSVDTGLETSLSSAGEINSLTLAYSLTVHKTQGSEYRRVFFITHHSQAVMFFRELIYVAVTRAKEELVIICEPNLFVQGITTQKLPGKTVEEKIEAFERVIRIDARKGEGNMDQIPKGLHRFIVKEEVEEVEDIELQEKQA